MFCFELEGRKVLGFDTGLDSRSFAQAKMARFITEPGLIVHGSSIGLWKACGVVETSNSRFNVKPTMVIWGDPFEGERLDTILPGPQDEALAAVIRWIEAIVTLNNTPQFSPALWPCAAIIGSSAGNNGVFFAPAGLTRHCTMTPEDTALFSNRFIHPDLEGIKAAAFTASAMLCRILSGSSPFSADNLSLLHQDMREGNFLPARLAIPGLDVRLAALMHHALDPNGIKTAALLNDIDTALHSGSQTVSISSLVLPLSEENRLLLEKEKAQFVKVKTASVRTKRFFNRNSARIIASCAALIIVVISAYSMARTRALRPSTAGLEPTGVIECFYTSMGELDHQKMEACVRKGAGKDDINMVINLFVISKVRESYESRSMPLIMPAQEWQQMGESSLPSGHQVFGVTDLNIKQITEDSEDTMQFYADYILWVPAEAVGDTENIEAGRPVAFRRSDLLTLTRRKGNWRITEVIRNEK